MPYIDPEVIAEAKRMNLLTYLQYYEPTKAALAGFAVFHSNRTYPQK